MKTNHARGYRDNRCGYARRDGRCPWNDMLRAGGNIERRQTDRANCNKVLRGFDSEELNFAPSRCDDPWKYD